MVESIDHTQKRDSLVISPGGSIVYSNSAMKHLKNISKIIYLKTSLEIIKNRIMVDNLEKMTVVKINPVGSIFTKSSKRLSPWRFC